MQVEVASTPGLFYRLERSVDLVDWSTLEVAEALTEQLNFTVPLSSGLDSVYLRLAEE